MKWMEKNWSAWNSLLLFWPIKVNAFLLLLGVGSITWCDYPEVRYILCKQHKTLSKLSRIYSSSSTKQLALKMIANNNSVHKNAQYLCGQCGVQCHVACSSRWAIVADVCQTCNCKFSNSCCCAIVIINLKPKKSTLVSVRIVDHQKAVEFIKVWKFLLLNTHHTGNWR